MVGTIMASMMTSELSRIIFSAAPIGPCGSKMPKSQPERLIAAATAVTGLATFNERPHLSRRTKHGFDLPTIGHVRAENALLISFSKHIGRRKIFIRRLLTLVFP